MPIEMAIDTKHDTVALSLTEAVGVHELVRSIRKALDDPRFHAGIKCFVDMREAAHTADGEVVRRVARLLIKNLEKVAGCKIAIIVGKTSTYGIIRMLQLQTQGMPFQVGVFYDPGEARTWFGGEGGPADQDSLTGDTPALSTVG